MTQIVDARARLHALQLLKGTDESMMWHMVTKHMHAARRTCVRDDPNASTLTGSPRFSRSSMGLHAPWVWHRGLGSCTAADHVLWLSLIAVHRPESEQKLVFEQVTCRLGMLEANTKSCACWLKYDWFRRGAKWACPIFLAPVAGENMTMKRCSRRGAPAKVCALLDRRGSSDGKGRTG